MQACKAEGRELGKQLPPQHISFSPRLQEPHTIFRAPISPQTSGHRRSRAASGAAQLPRAGAAAGSACPPCAPAPHLRQVGSPARKVRCAQVGAGGQAPAVIGGYPTRRSSPKPKSTTFQSMQTASMVSRSGIPPSSLGSCQEASPAACRYHKRSAKAARRP